MVVVVVGGLGHDDGRARGDLGGISAIAHRTVSRRDAIRIGCDCASNGIAGLVRIGGGLHAVGVWDTGRYVAAATPGWAYVIGMAPATCGPTMPAAPLYELAAPLYGLGAP